MERSGVNRRLVVKEWMAPIQEGALRTIFVNPNGLITIDIKITKRDNLHRSYLFLHLRDPEHRIDFLY